MVTQVNEDANKAMSQTAKASATKRIGDVRAYHALISKEVLTKVHHFSQPQEVVHTARRGECFDEGAFRVVKQRVWQDLFSIRGFGEPKWYSPKAEDTNARVAEHFTL